VTIANEVRTLRAALDEDTATFGARWHKSGRTIEGWEQGRRAPEPFVLEDIRKLAARTKAATAKRDATDHEVKASAKRMLAKHRKLLTRLAKS
jgi:hypothetical protein